jgi:hypothetical protein
MESTNIFSQIRQEKTDFLNEFISIVPGYSFNQYETLKRINLYLNSKFEGSSTYLNREKLFFNVVVPACEVATKMLDVDTKDIRLLPQDPKSFFASYLLEKELKQWLKTSKLANVLNQIADQGPKFGSVVLEKTKDGAEVVDLRKLILDPTVETIGDSRFVTTISYMTPSELRETTWDNVDVAIERFGHGTGQESYEDESGGVNQLQSTPYIKVYKRYGEVPQYWIDGGKSEKMVKALFIVAGADAQEKNEQGQIIGEYGVVLFKSRWYKPYPFKDFHYTKIMGRWLGLGIVEALFDTQVRLNELKNQKRISMELSTIHLFQTKDKQVVRNILTDLESGALLYSPNGIEPVVNEERNLSAFDSEEASYIQQGQRLSFAYDAVSGETSAASTTATAVINAQQQASSTFGFKRENYTNMLRDFFNDLVLPQIMTDLTAEHIMRFTGSSQELVKLDNAAAELHANDKIKEAVLAGKTLTPEKVALEKQRALTEYKKMGDNRFIKLKDNFYKDVKFEFDFNIGNEQINPQAMADNIQALLAGYNPQAMADPRYKLLYFKYAETLGISQGEIELADEQANQMMSSPAEILQPGQQAGLPPVTPQLPSNEQVQNA